MSAKLDDRSLHMIRRAQANANRLLTLINDILDISRIESGRMQIVNSDVSLSDLVERLQSQMGVLADEKLLTFNVDLDPTLPPTISIDEDAITKITTNLLGNAFKFTEKGGVTLNISQKEDKLVIMVSDTGIGIPTHMHDVIFERFRQVDGSSKRTHGGSGLGLAIVQKLALALNGTITVQSVVGEGSTFTVVLPLETTHEKVVA
jgi:signal transduction histidine kinase